MRREERKQRRVFFHWRYVPFERRRGYRRWAVILVLSIPLFFFCERYLLSAGRVTDVSMLPTLTPGSYFLVNKYVYRFRRPRRGEIVVFRPPGKDRWYYVKRVIGLEEEILSISSGQVYVKGKALEEPYVLGITSPDLAPVAIPKRSYFLLGDNRPDSEDSRSFGSIPLDRIHGKIRPGRRFTLW